MPSRRLVLGFALSTLSAAVRAELTAGRDYVLLQTPQPPDTPGKIEVIEFFSYGCPHCYSLNPLFNNWSAKLPADVVIKKVAVGFGRPQWVNLAKTYYALDSMGQTKKLDNAVFDAVHRQQLPFTDEHSIMEWVGKQGVDKTKFTAAYSSFSVNTRLAQSEQLIRRYKIDQVPTLTVGGKFVVGGNSFEEMLAIADQLIVKARQEGQRQAAARATSGG
jgi:protein dithiol oxidoreductase (disulfide-forming)